MAAYSIRDAQPRVDATRRTRREAWSAVECADLCRARAQWSTGFNNVLLHSTEFDCALVVLFVVFVVFLFVIVVVALMSAVHGSQPMRHAPRRIQ